MTQRRPDIGYIPTSLEVVEAMLTLVGLKKDDILYDLGCGDGRIVIAAAQQKGSYGIGIDIDSERIREAELNAKNAGIAHRVKFRQQDLFCCDFRDATVVFLYLLPHLNLRLRNELFRQLKPGSRVVSLDFDMGDWKPDKVKKFQNEEESTLYYWVISEEILDRLKL
ncbi:MAG TPA: methyltransferase domain-containing protein [Cyanophyceae cyanobacterium]